MINKDIPRAKLELPPRGAKAFIAKLSYKKFQQTRWVFFYTRNSSKISSILDGSTKCYRDRSFMTHHYFANVVIEPSKI